MQAYLESVSEKVDRAFPKMRRHTREFDREDLEQESALKLLKGGYDLETSSPGLISNAVYFASHTMMRVMTADCRGYGRRESLGDGARLRKIEPGYIQSYEDDLDAEDELKRLRIAISMLTGVCREAVTLRYIRGMSIVEIAENLGITENTAECRVRRGVKVLREEYAEDIAMA